MDFKDSLNSFMHTLPVIMGTFVVIRFDYETIYILYALTRFVRSPVEYSVHAMFMSTIRVTFLINTLRKYSYDNGNLSQ